MYPHYGFFSGAAEGLDMDARNPDSPFSESVLEDLGMDLFADNALLPKPASLRDDTDEGFHSRDAVYGDDAWLQAGPASDDYVIYDEPVLETTAAPPVREDGDEAAQPAFEEEAEQPALENDTEATDDYGDDDASYQDEVLESGTVPQVDNTFLPALLMHAACKEVALLEATHGVAIMSRDEASFSFVRDHEAALVGLERAFGACVPVLRTGMLVHDMETYQQQTGLSPKDNDDVVKFVLMRRPVFARRSAHAVQSFVPCSDCKKRAALAGHVYFYTDACFYARLLLCTMCSAAYF